MKSTIKKLKIDLKALHRAKANLTARIPLTRKDRKVLISLIEAENQKFWQPGLLQQLKNGLSQVFPNERRILLEIIKASEGYLYPSEMTIDRYHYYLSQIEKLDPVKDEFQHQHLAEQILEFRNKYCR